MARYVKNEKVADVLDISDVSVRELLPKRDRHNFHSPDESDVIPCTPCFTLRLNVTATKHAIPL
jgi:hypothetical protein